MGNSRGYCRDFTSNIIDTFHVTVHVKQCVKIEHFRLEEIDSKSQKSEQQRVNLLSRRMKEVRPEKDGGRKRRQQSGDTAATCSN